MANPNGSILSNIGASSLAKASAANALDKNPASVIPICIVARNLLGSLSIFLICFAFLFPSLLCFSIFASFKDMNAISAAAKKAFTAINMTKTISREIICLSFTLPFFIINSKYYTNFYINCQGAGKGLTYMPVFGSFTTTSCSFSVISGFSTSIVSFEFVTVIVNASL